MKLNEIERYKPYSDNWEEITEPGALKYRNFACVYACVNMINGKIYIGGTRSLFKRLPKHKYRLNLNKHENQHLQNAYNKYGKENFVWYIVEKCTEEMALIAEQKYLDLFKPFDRGIGYNIQSKAENRKHTEETKEKIREKRKLQIPYWTGKKMTDEQRTNISKGHMGQIAWNKGKKLSEAHRIKCGLANKGNRHSEEAKSKMSASKKGRPSHNKGIPWTEKQRYNMIKSALRNKFRKIILDYCLFELIQGFDKGEKNVLDF